MKKTALLLLLPLFSFLFQPTMGKEKSNYKLISYNIRTGSADDGTNSWKYRDCATKQMLNQEKPDVMGVQEAKLNQLNYIKKEAPQYSYVGVNRDSGKQDNGETMAIFYLHDRFDLLDSGTFWISETPEKVSKGWDGACRRTVTWVELLDKTSGKSFYYFNTHLDHKGKVAREKGVLLVLDKMKQIAGKKAPVILGGDLNTSIDDAIFSPLKSWMKVAREKAAVTDHKGSYNGFGSAPDTILIDHLFFRGKIKCNQFRTLDGNYGAPYISDHYPIEMDFTL